MAIALSLMVLTTIALMLGAGYLLKRGGARKQAILMLILAAVLAGNVAIWTLPDKDGQTLSRAVR